MSEEQKHDIQRDIEQLENLGGTELDLVTATEEVGLEDLDNGQGITEAGASVFLCGGSCGCCSTLCGKS